MSRSIVLRFAVIVLGAPLLAVGRPVAAPLAEQGPGARYSVASTLPGQVDGRLLRSFTYDPVEHRLYVASDRALFWVDLHEAKPTLKGPLLKGHVMRIEMAPDLGRLFYLTYDDMGYINIRTSGAPVRIGARAEAGDLVYEPTRQEVYVAVGRTPKVRVYDARSGERGTDIDLPGWWAHNLEAIPGRVFLQVANKNGLYTIDAATHQLAPWRVAGRVVTPAYVEADPAGRHLFLAYSREIVAIDTQTAAVVGRLTTASSPTIAYDPGANLLLTTWHNVDPPSINVVAYRVDSNGLTEVTRLRNPSAGGVGLEATSRGFVQSGWKSLLVWAYRDAG